MSSANVCVSVWSTLAYFFALPGNKSSEATQPIRAKTRTRTGTNDRILKVFALLGLGSILPPPFL